MTEIKIVIDESENEYIILLSGHAGYNPGNDIVCSAISQLICTYASLISEQRENIDLYELHMGEGNVVIRFACKRNRMYISAITEFIERGFKMLEGQYPEYVRCRLEKT